VGGWSRIDNRVLELAFKSQHRRCCRGYRRGSNEEYFATDKDKKRYMVRKRRWELSMLEKRGIDN
jgi:hypothetical protein